MPDPHTLLSNIPPDTGWYRVIDLCSAFFSVPLHPDLHLFALTFQGQQYIYTRLLQAFVESPSIFNQVLAEDIYHLEVQSTIIQYMHDIYLASPTRAQYEHDLRILLQALAKGGHKVNKDKLHFCQREVEYLRCKLSANEQKLAFSHIETITSIPKPQTVRQMLSFLGMTGFSRAWICDYAIKSAPLRATLQWTDEAEQSFQALKHDSHTPALGNPDYSKPFHLYVAERLGYACAVLMQDGSAGKKPLVYYSTKLDNIEAGFPPYYQGLAAAVFAFQKASSISMGHPSILYTSHQLHALLTSPRFVLTQAR